MEEDDSDAGGDGGGHMLIPLNRCLPWKCHGEDAPPLFFLFSFISLHHLSAPFMLLGFFFVSELSLLLFISAIMNRFVVVGFIFSLIFFTCCVDLLTPSILY